ncbi:hypothetical protein N7495_006795 [Penicillium taxi]|uniref:uncharacterized protein n=1 Tax=Penicillium taxi TaxID=168475 RepID=UPI002545679D|nr:uncharacterized protein N7495_006795 [Penicillium taxi]KAJ5895104.1 hypothetical protein N7495_006795 [Penicillium taxi]
MDSPTVNPFWGPQTSYLNFCEEVKHPICDDIEDYIITRFIAEFINTCSSFVYIFFGIYGLLGLRHKNKAGMRWISYYGLIGVGACSGGYHMTLKYHTQMSDELSMHLLTTPLLFRVLTYKATPQHTKIVGSILLTMFTIVMVTHMVMDEFLLHAVTFGLAALLITTRTTSLISHEIPDPTIKKKFRIIANVGLFSFIFGYLIWLVDGYACGSLTDIKHMVGLPLGFLFEFHGWWHFFTGIGGYAAVSIVDLITADEVHQDPTSQLAWPLAPAARAADAIFGSKEKV